MQSISTEMVAERIVPERHVERILPGSGKRQVPRDGVPQCGETSAAVEMDGPTGIP